MRKIILLLVVLLSANAINAKSTELSYNNSSLKIENTNHPQVLYWFWTPDLMKSGKYMEDLEFIAQKTPFNLIFLTARENLDFFNYSQMEPIFSEVVARAHELGLKIAIQFWDDNNNMPLEEMFSIIAEGTVTLDDNGKTTYIGEAKHIRLADNTPRATNNKIISNRLYKAYSFEKVDEGYYKENSLEDITLSCKAEEIADDKVQITIDKGEQFAGQTVYIMTQHIYDWNDIYGGFAAKQFTSILEKYSHIPFDGVGLDEYKHLQSDHAGTIKSKGETWNERFYSSHMSDIYSDIYKRDMAADLLAMRYTASGDDLNRVRAINSYMDLMRSGPKMVEEQFYKDGKRIFGDDCFIGLHNTYHTLTTDEIWQTGANWWTIPRDYGHTDELCALPTQMGVLVCNKKNVLYNMYYHKDAEKIYQKAAQDLAFGIRTHYHAMNDNHGWGVKLESPEFLNNIAPIEDAANLLNLFNPAPAKLNTLIVFGMEALQNNYPDIENSTSHKLNSKIDPEAIAVKLWKAGYRNALVSSDVIDEGKIEIKNDGTLSINGNEFQQLVYLYPNYAKTSALEFLEKYTLSGKQPIIVGDFHMDFNGEAANIDSKVFENSCSSSDISKFLATEDKLPEFGSINRDGSYVELFATELIAGQDVDFSFSLEGKVYSGRCQGLIALQASNKVDKIAAKGLTILKCNGKTILEFNSPTDLFYSDKNLMSWGENVKIKTSKLK